MSGAGVGGLTNPGTSERMGRTRMGGEKGEGTQQGRNGAVTRLFAFPGGRRGLKVETILEIQYALRLTQTSCKSGGAVQG